MKKPKKPTTTALARKLGVSRSTLYQWREDGAPLDKGESAVLAWAMKETRRNQPDNELRAAKLAVLRETERRLKTANDVKSRAVVSLSEVNAAWSTAIGLLWHGLGRLADELPPAISGLSPDAMGRSIALAVDCLKADMSAALNEHLGQKIDVADAKNQVIAKHVFEVVSARTFHERCEQDYRQFKKWLTEETKLTAEHRERWLRARAAAEMPVPNASDDEVAKFNVKRAE